MGVNYFLESFSSTFSIPLKANQKWGEVSTPGYCKQYSNWTPVYQHAMS